MCMNFILASLFLFCLLFRWQCYDKLCPVVITFCQDSSSVQLHDLFGDRKSQTCAAGSCRSGTIHAIEFLEYRLKHIARNLITCIGKCDLDVTILHFRFDPDLRICIAVSNCIS